MFPCLTQMRNDSYICLECLLCHAYSAVVKALRLQLCLHEIYPAVTKDTRKEKHAKNKKK